MIGGDNRLPAARTFAVPLFLLVAGCVTTTETRWVRPGATDSTIVRDASDCSAIAWTKAERLNPYGPQISTPGALDPATLARQQRVDIERFAAANRFDDLCMLNRGYQGQESPAGPRPV